MSSVRNRIDIKYKAYNRNNKDHLDFIQEEIDKFNQHQNELRRYDKRTELLYGFMAGSWLLGYTSLFGALVTSTVYTLISAKYFGRPDYYDQQQDQLKSLYDIYCWCIKSYGKSSTYDPMFLNLVETLAPWEEINNLKKPFKDWNDVSPRFQEILCKHPQRALFVNEKQQDIGLVSYFKSFFTKNEQSINQNEEKAKHEGNVMSKMQEKYFYTLYGHKSEKSKGLTSTLLDEGREKMTAVIKNIL